jgi:hemoglobin
MEHFEQNTLALRLKTMLEDGTIRRLVDAFYPRVAKDPILHPLFPDDLTEIAEKQYMFLTQFFGGPTLYFDAYGQPAMRMRHMPFEITPVRAQVWLANMSAAMEEIGLDGELRNFMYERLAHVAPFMVNTTDVE